MKTLNKTQAKKKAWSNFSTYIRNKYAVGGLVTCYTCDRKLPVKQMQCGHGIGGRANAVLFMEEVCRPQCVGCNVWGRGKYSVFTLKLIEEYGALRYAELVKEANQLRQYKVHDYLEIADKYAIKNR